MRLDARTRVLIEFRLSLKGDGVTGNPTDRESPILGNSLHDRHTDCEVPIPLLISWNKIL